LQIDSAYISRKIPVVDFPQSAFYPCPSDGLDANADKDKADLFGDYLVYTWQAEGLVIHKLSYY